MVFNRLNGFKFHRISHERFDRWFTSSPHVTFFLLEIRNVFFSAIKMSFLDNSTIFVSIYLRSDDAISLVEYFETFFKYSVSTQKQVIRIGKKRRNYWLIENFISLIERLLLFFLNFYQSTWFTKYLLEQLMTLEIAKLALNLLQILFNRDSLWAEKLAQLPVWTNSYDAKLVNGEIVSRVHLDWKQFLGGKRMPSPERASYINLREKFIFDNFISHVKGFQFTSSL